VELRDHSRNQRSQPLGSAAPSFSSQRLCPDRSRKSPTAPGENDYNLFREDYSDSDWIIDIGAHAGTFSLFAATHTNARILSLEPEPANFSLLQKNVELNKLSQRITAQKKALCVTNDDRTLYPHATNSGAHSFLKSEERKQGNITTQCTTLQQLLEKYNVHRVAFLKMDIEGAEYEAVFATPSAALRKIKRMAIELHPHPSYSFEDMIKFLKNNNFLVKWSKTPRLIQVWRNDI